MAYGKGGRAPPITDWGRRFSAPIRRDVGWTYYDLNAQAYFGNSGGPVVDLRTGKLVGVIQSILGDGKTKSCCIPYGEALRALSQLPADEKQQAAANRVAAARHALDVIATRLPEMETKADIAMNAQCLRLLGKSRGLEFYFELPDKTVVLLSDYLTALKQLYQELSVATKPASATIESTNSIPQALRGAVSLRIEKCWNMYTLASATTNTLKGFQGTIARRKAESDSAIKNFNDEYAKYLDAIDAKAVKGK